MSDAVSKFFKAQKSARSKKSQQSPELVSLMMGALSAVTGALNLAQIQEINNLLQKIKQLLMLKEVSRIKPAIGSLDKPKFPPNQQDHVTVTNEPDQSREAMLMGLEKITTSRICPVIKKRIFLLHRPTADFEYNKSKRAATVRSPEPKEPEGTQGSDNTETYPDYETKIDTNWVIDSVLSEKIRMGKNPIVSVWVPETHIKDVRGGQQGVGAWGDLGANADKNIVTVVVKPGIYKIYSELKA